MKLTKKAYSLIYRARRKGVCIETRSRTILVAHDAGPRPRMCARLCREFGFVIQLGIV